MADDNSEISVLELVTELTIAWLGNRKTRVSADDVPAFVEKMHATLSRLVGGNSAPEPLNAEQSYTPAVTARKSLGSKDHIISLIDGKPYKTLRRHLSGHGLTPEQYRERFNLKSDYPMVAQAYSEQRREMAKKIGLGRKPSTKLRRRKAPVPQV